MSETFRVPALRVPIDSELTLPGSKSHANRAIVCASLASGRTIIRNATPCDDVLVMVENLRAMGFRIHWSNIDIGELTVEGGIPLENRVATLDCHNAGTTLRFLVSLAALVPGQWTITGDSFMKKRPIRDLVDALRELGAEIEDTASCPPVRIRGGLLTGAAVSLKADVSSQYLTSLLLIAPALPQGLVVHQERTLVSKGYVDLTKAVMEDFGVKIVEKSNTFIVHHARYCTKNVYTIEGDWSAAGAWLALNAATGSSIRFTNLPSHSKQSDRQLPAIIEKMRSRGDLVIQGGNTPDQIMNIAVLAALRKEKTVISGVRNLRFKECDRLHVLTQELLKTGIRITEHEDGLTIQGSGSAQELAKNAKDVTLNPHQDHRMAMCFTLLGLLRGGVTIRHPDCVRKSYPRFFSDLESLLRSTRPISIIGMRGVGKSNFGKRLASRLELSFQDSDHLFEKKHGRIPAFVIQKGWKVFRAEEEKIIRAALRPGMVLSVGGGAVESDVTREFLKKHSIPVWLMATEKELLRRLGTAKRPALTDLPLKEEIHQMLLKRSPQYRMIAAIAIPPESKFAEHVPQVFRALTALVRTHPFQKS